MKLTADRWILEGDRVGDVARALLGILERGAAEPVEHDPEWPSPCEMLPPDDRGMVNWRPIPMDPAPTFEGIPLHPSLREFIGSFWGGTAGGRHSDELVVGLNVAWNAEELDRMIQFIRAQVLAGEPVAVATTDSDLYFGVDNATGTVWLCEAGYPPITQVAASLAEFLAGVE